MQCNCRLKPRKFQDQNTYAHTHKWLFTANTERTNRHSLLRSRYQIEPAVMFRLRKTHLDYSAFLSFTITVQFFNSGHLLSI